MREWKVTRDAFANMRASCVEQNAGMDIGETLNAISDGEDRERNIARIRAYTVEQVIDDCNERLRWHAIRQLQYPLTPEERAHVAKLAVELIKDAKDEIAKYEKPAKHSANWGGARAGSGAKPIGDKAGVRFQITLPAELREKLRELGGSRWIAEQLRKIDNN